MKKLSTLILALIFTLQSSSVFAGRMIPPSRAKQIRTDTTNFDGTLSGADTTVQKALETLDDAIAGAGSGDITAVGSCATGNCAIEGGNDMFPLIYEGTADTSETTFAVTDPTSDKTITFPDKTGTVQVGEVSSSDINWQTLEEIQTGDINWDSIINQEIQAEGINWNSLQDNIGDIAINWDNLYDSIKDVHIDWGTGANQVSSEDLPVPEIGTATYDNLEDFINNTMSSGFISGGDITDNGDGTVDVAAGTGYIRVDSSEISELQAFDWSASASLNTTDDALNYVYINYNAGNPVVAYTTDLSTLDHTSEFVIGLVYQEATEAHISMAGQRLNNFIHDVFFHLWEHDGIERSSGLVSSEDGTEDLAINITAGVIYWALYRHTVSAFDSSTDGANQTFELFYRDGIGGWTTGDVNALNSTNYDDGDGTLGTLTVNRYGVFWVYSTVDGDIYVQYGQGDYTLAQAKAASAPATMDEVSSIGVLIAKIIIQQGDTDFYSVTLPWSSNIGTTPASDHGALAGLADDDHTQYGALAQNETITGNWVNETYPWSANEVNWDSLVDNIQSTGINWNSMENDVINDEAINWANFDGYTTGRFLQATATGVNWATVSGSGDMLTTTYDTDSNSIVDAVDNVNADDINWDDFNDVINDESINWQNFDGFADDYYLRVNGTSVQWETVTGGGGGRTNLTLAVQAAKLTGAFTVFTPPTADACTVGAGIDAGDGNWRLLFDDTTDECATWQFVMPDNYASAPKVDIHYTMNTATADDVEFEAAIMCVSDGDSADVGTASFSNVAVGTATVPGTAGHQDVISITLNDDSCAASDMVWLVISTDANDATNDDATGDREVIGVEFNYTGN